ncbi:RNA polymerase sigma factor [Aquisphaera giovannonii]|uniref:RNA polymerase sigma factor n=1 Tax=Aquisphaera giovannonii TaxID=406548 RepID=UPI001AEF3CDE|nr:RNA polymerase sigma factor [Aquisphaera giovannonii]
MRFRSPARDAGRRFPLFTAMDTSTITRTLWLKAREGDKSAYDRLFALHADRALMFIRARLGPRLRASVESVDVLQEAYLAAHAGFDRFEYAEGDDGAFLRWLFRIVENRLRDLNDRAGAKKRRPVELPRLDPATGPVTAAERAERREALVRALDALEDDHRRVILLRYFEGLSAEEAGRLMDRSPGAIRKLAARALAALGEKLEPNSR